MMIDDLRPSEIARQRRQDRKRHARDRALMTNGSAKWFHAMASSQLAIAKAIEAGERVVTRRRRKPVR